MNRVLAAIVVALGALVPAEVGGQSAQRDYIVLLLPESETPTSLRLKAEIAKLGLNVHVAATNEPVDPDEPRMAELAQLFGGEALVVLSPDGRVATIWFSKAEQGEKLKRVVQAQGGSEDMRSESVVVGTLELLRVRLVLRREAPEPARPAAPAPAPPPPPPAPPPPLEDYRPLLVGAVVGLDKPGPKLSFGSSYQLNVDFQLSKPIGLRVLGRLPAASSQASLAGATAEVESLIAGGGFTFGFDTAQMLRLDVLAGAGAARVVAQGFSPELPAQTSREREWLLVGLGGLRSALRIAPVLNVTAQAGLTFSTRPVELVLNEQTAAVWGRPALFFGIGLELRPKLR